MNKIMSKMKIFVLASAIFVSLAFVAYPFIPLVDYYVRSNFFAADYSVGELKEYMYDSQQADSPAYFGNRLTIPKIGVDMGIIDSFSEEYALSLGAWRLPTTSTPDKGSNTAFSAHRFKYLPPHSETFYLLDKLEYGDWVHVYWEGEEYIYQVISSQIVSPYDAEVLDESEKPTITLITCNPLFSTKERLIVKAEMISTLAKIEN